MNSENEKPEDKKQDDRRDYKTGAVEFGKGASLSCEDSAFELEAG